MSSNKKVVPSESLQIIIPECGSCKRTISKNIIKCNVCEKVYHPGCANKIKKCCDEDFATPSGINAGGISPMSDCSNKNISNESTHHDLLLKIIFELESKNALLLENNSLLKYKISSLERDIVNNKIVVDNLNEKLARNINIHKKVSISSPAVRSPARNYPSTTENVDVGSAIDTVTVDPCSADASRASSSNVADAKMNTLSRNNKFKQRNPTNSATEDTHSRKHVSIPNSNIIREPSNTKTSEDWSVVRHRRPGQRRRALVLGSCSENTTVEGIEKLKIFHVSNLKPETTVESLNDFLKVKFSSVRCEKLTSKYPENYSSFKVFISSSEYDKALDGTNWPNRASIHHFFQPRKNNPPTD